eukprot:4196502-Alexandrium_andersonii.AAC.1
MLQRQHLVHLCWVVADAVFNVVAVDVAIVVGDGGDDGDGEGGHDDVCDVDEGDGDDDGDDADVGD